MSISSEAKQGSVRRAALCAETFDGAGDTRSSCVSCARAPASDAAYAMPWVPKGWRGTARRLALVVGDNDVRTSRAGGLMRRLAREAGYTTKEVAYIGAVRCATSSQPTMAQVRACRPYLLRALSVARPTHIVGLGSTALRALTNDGTSSSIIAVRGRHLPVPGLAAAWGEGTLPLAWCTYGPESCLQGGIHLEDYIRADLGRDTQPELTYPGSLPLYGGPVVAVDSEYSPTGNLLTLGIANRYCAIGADIDEEGWIEQARSALSSATHVVGHAIAGDIDQLVKLGLARPEWVDGRCTLDSLLLARMSDENRGKGGYALESLLLSRHNASPWKAETDAILKRTGDASSWSPAQRTERCRLDAWASYMVAADHVGRGSARPALREYTHRTAMTLHRMYLAGAAIDMDQFAALGSGWQREATRARDVVMKAAHASGLADFSPTDDNAIRKWVYDRLGCAVGRRTEKTGVPKVDRVTLAQFVPDHPAIAALIEFNRADKLVSTWYGSDRPSASTRPPLRDTIVPVRPGVGRLQFRINPLGARTGRRSSGGGDGPTQSRNSQNWPKAARAMVRSRWDGGKVGAFDYSKLEVVIMGWIAGDDKLLEYFTEGEGYVGAARDMFGQSVEEGTEQYRIAKSIILGTNYNMGPWKLAHDLWYRAGTKLDNDWAEHRRLAKSLRERYLDAFPGVRRYIAGQLDAVSERGRVTSPVGRVRHLPHHGPSTEGYWHLQNQAVNYPVQSFAADVTASALMDAEAAIIAEHGISLLEWHEMLLDDPMGVPCSVLINEVHDELTCDLHPQSWRRDADIIIEAMRDVRSLRTLCPTWDIPLRVGVSIGTRWAVESDI